MQVKMRSTLRNSGFLLISTFSVLFNLASGNVKNSFRVAMPNVVPTEDDNYLCIAFPINDLVQNKDSPIYITKFEADSDANKAHHIILQSCRSVGVSDGTQKPWDCRHHQTCEDGEEILFAWAKRAPPTEMPNEVTFKVDPTQSPYLILQVHYAHKMEETDSSAINIEYQSEP